MVTPVSSLSNSLSLRIAMLMNRGIILRLLLSSVILPAISNISAVRYSRTAAYKYPVDWRTTWQTSCVTAIVQSLSYPWHRKRYVSALCRRTGDSCKSTVLVICCTLKLQVWQWEFWCTINDEYCISALRHALRWIQWLCSIVNDVSTLAETVSVIWREEWRLALGCQRCRIANNTDRICCVWI